MTFWGRKLIFHTKCEKFEIVRNLINLSQKKLRLPYKYVNAIYELEHGYGCPQIQPGHSGWLFCSATPWDGTVAVLHIRPNITSYDIEYKQI